MKLQDYYYITCTILNCIVFIAFLWNIDKILYGFRKRKYDQISKMEEKINEIQERYYYQDAQLNKRKR